MSLWGNLKRYITGYDELPETAVGLDGTITTPNRYKAQLEAQSQGLPTNVVNGMAQGNNSGSVDADNLMKKYNAYEQPQAIHHNGLADGILGTPNKSVVAYDDKGQPLYSETERQGGLINDFTEGFRDNYNNRLTTGNLADNTMADGRQKNLINRIGEGFGTAGRILESPAGRSLLVGGLVGATGGSGLQALGYGLGTGMLNQQNRMKDRIYRRNLIEQAQRSVINSDEYKNAESDYERQQMLDDVENQVNSYRGYVGDDTYRQVLTGMQLRDNAEYRNALLADREKNLRAEILMKQADLDYKRKRDAKNDYYENQKIAQGWAKIKQDNKTTGNVDKVKNLQAVQAQLQRFEDSFADMPNKFESNTLGRLRNATGFQTKKEANFNSQRTLLFNKIARDLGGEKGVLSDQDIKRIEKALPDYTDSYAQKKAKMQAIWELLGDRMNVEVGTSNASNDVDNDPLGIR